MKTFASWTLVVAIYALAFIVNSWIAGVLLVSHITYEWLDFQDQRNMVTQLRRFKDLDNKHQMDTDLLENYLEPLTLPKKKDTGNC